MRLNVVYLQGLLPTPSSAPISQGNVNQAKLAFPSNTNGYNKVLSNHISNRTSNYSNPNSNYNSQNGSGDYQKHSDRAIRTPDKQFTWKRIDSRKDNKDNNHSNHQQDTLGHQHNDYSFQRQRSKKGRL